MGQVQLIPGKTPYAAFNIQPVNRSQFLEPFRAMGTPGVERLAQMIGRRETTLIELYRTCHSKLPRGVAGQLPVPLNAKRVREQAAAILIMLGEQSRTATPTILKHLRSQDPEIRLMAAEVLMPLVGPQDGQVVSELLKPLNDQDGRVRWLILQAHFKIESEPLQTIPVLLKELNHPEESHRLYSAERLARFLPEEAERIQPALEQAQTDPSSTVRRAASYALQLLASSEEQD